ncbi:carboxymuconolactone decarboxylase family protein [Dickeya fangzhongdai]|uniref:Carboxymuconolactone decarboxylase family protein n=1 Tax=Dickeya undicola TaxID=1577887 RepID=A0A3N0FXF3_9GAMM|nr:MULTISPECIES: carboxymuconolactone decarboxylase family protein [Dickeya]KHN58480.1 alkylhydroperoxidase [Dickeya fangzhongdai]RNM04650.1 carboxymuconolactone decarboxylase family protein [Dickeya undicola]UMB76140.1 carboxymuconolactone decarboxylase family protein [Dickeya fangzhongdai]WPD74833.1 carboxymuconolactone decarboxylase family protein [Dickeya fangzhongdai]
MSHRFTIDPNGYKAMYGVHQYVQGCGLDIGLLELLRLRISQINGCAYCIAMHIPMALESGVSGDKVNLVAAWHEAGIFSPRECAALAWAEAVTLLPQRTVPDEVYAQARAEFSEQELANLTMAAVEINSWNRLMIASQTPPELKNS